MLARPSPMCTLDGASIPHSAYRRSRTSCGASLLNSTYDRCCDAGDVSWARLIVRGPLVPRVVPCLRHRTEHLAHLLLLHLRRPCLRLEAPPGERIAAVACLPRPALQEQHALVQRRQRAPQRVSQRSLLIRRDALRREPVTHLASEAQEPAVANLGQHAAVLGAGERRRDPLPS